MLEKAVTEILNACAEQGSREKPFLIAIDGRSCAGKSTLAAALGERLSCPVIPMDHFFLRPEQRVPSRFRMPGGNVDHERFLGEVLLPLRRGEAPLSYRPFDCKTMDFASPVFVPASPVYVVEGSYACHPLLWKYCDLHVFLTVDPDTQRQRILKRNGPEDAARFFERWIPLEELYFDAFQIPSHCALSYQI